MEDLLSQLERTRELHRQLYDSCRADLGTSCVSSKTKNITQEIMVKLRSVLDQVWYQIVTKRYPNNDKQIKIYFPIVKSGEALSSMLARVQIPKLKEEFPDIYNFIISVQPYYAPNNKVLRELVDLSNERHFRLTPHNRKETERVEVSSTVGGGSVSWIPSQVKINGYVRINGVPINPATQLPEASPYIKTEVVRYVTFVFDGTETEILSFCNSCIERVYNIVQQAKAFI